MKSRFPHPYSLLAILLLFVLMVQARLWAPYWDTHNVQAILTWDAMGYYIYLPAHFIYHDLGHMALRARHHARVQPQQLVLPGVSRCRAGPRASW